MKILDRFTGALKFEFNAPTMKLTLQAAIKEKANLYGADLGGADLGGADLGGANLRGANLYGANLRDANLGGANLRGANLGGADLYGANLRGANLRGANLRGANLGGANLRDADLRDANLCGADLRGADLRWTKFLEQQCITPDGVLIGYKKINSGAIVTLRIPAKAARLNAYGSRKCRAAYATVIAIDGKPGTDRRSGTLKYAVGKKVVPDSFDDDKRVECSHGIHFFITRAEAEAY